jgi:type I restriction enzyme, R subunit
LRQHQVSTDLQEREPRRSALYKAVVSLVRAYANIADELEAAGYGTDDIARIKREVDQYVALREIIRKAAAKASI